MAMAASQAASSGTATAVGGTTNPIQETIVGSHMIKIEGFSGTKDLGVGKSIKSSTFHVGGHGWYIECYPCGVDDDENSVGYVTVRLCLSDHNEEVEAGYLFTLMSYDADGHLRAHQIDVLDIEHKSTFNADTLWRRGLVTDFEEREELELLLKEDCLQIRCDVCISKEFPAVPPLDLHPPLSDLPASRMAGVHRGLQGPSSHVEASPTSAAGASTAATISTENVDGSHVLTIEGYSNVKKLFGCPGSSFIQSDWFDAGGQLWQMKLYPSGHDKIDANCLAVFIHRCYKAVKVRLKLTLLTLTREEVISSTQSCYASCHAVEASVDGKYCSRCCYFPFNMEPESSSLLGDSFHVKCDVTVLKEITPMRPPDLHLHFGNLLASGLGTDLTFDVGGELFSAHKCVLATRSTTFLAQFFGPGMQNRADVTHVRIHDIEPRVFKALLNFIYTDALPEVHEDDKVVMAQGLLVSADQYALERLKLICGDILCNYVNDARTAVSMLELAVKHGCHRLKEKCKKFIIDNFAKVAPIP